MKYIDCQFHLALARAQFWHASIVSGAYKTRRLQCGTDKKAPDGSIVFRDMTDEEKLADAMAVMDRHIQTAQDMADAIAGSERAVTAHD